MGCTISHALYSAATRNLREKGQNWVKVSPPSVKYGLSSASAKLVTRQVNGLEIRRLMVSPTLCSPFFVKSKRKAAPQAVNK